LIVFPGLEVRALARDPSRFPAEVREKIQIVQGDVLNPTDVEKTVEGVEGVVIVLGTRNDVRKSLSCAFIILKSYYPQLTSARQQAFAFLIIALDSDLPFLLGPTTMMSEGTKNILAAMSKADIKPVSACLSG